MLPFESEPRDRLEARFSLALTPTFDSMRCAAGIGPFPGTQRRHVFDFENGVRMIVSMDAWEGSEKLHFSFGMSPGCKLTEDEFIAFPAEVIAEFWKPDFKVIMRQLTPCALHIFCSTE